MAKSLIPSKSPNKNDYLTNLGNARYSTHASKVLSSPLVASKASKSLAASVLSDPRRSSRANKTIAASVLSQSRHKQK